MERLVYGRSPLQSDRLAEASAAEASVDTTPDRTNKENITETRTNRELTSEPVAAM